MVPDYQSFMRPLLQLIADGKEWKFREVVEKLSDQFELSAQDRAVRLPSGSQLLVDNRIGWAKTYLKKAGLLDSPRRAFLQITVRGREALSLDETINTKFLYRYAAFQEFQSSAAEPSEERPLAQESTQTPEEALAFNYRKIRAALADELLGKVMEASPSFFERLVVDLLVRMGYGGSFADAAQAIGKSGDEGIDGIIKEDRLGLDVIYVQAKRWKDTVGRPEIQKFAGALQGQRAKKGIFITTSQFSADAIEFVSKVDSKMVLIDGVQLAAFMIDFAIGVFEIETYALKRVDSDYFIEE